MWNIHTYIYKYYALNQINTFNMELQFTAVIHTYIELTTIQTCNEIHDKHFKTQKCITYKLSTKSILIF
jgi:hypothetical protein